MGLSDKEVEDLKSTSRRRCRPMRDVLVYLVWRDGHHTAEAVGEFFQVTYTARPSARVRWAEDLKKNRRLRAAPRNRLLT